MIVTGSVPGPATGTSYSTVSKSKHHGHGKKRPKHHGAKNPKHPGQHPGHDKSNHLVAIETSNGVVIVQTTVIAYVTSPLSSTTSGITLATGLGPETSGLSKATVTTLTDPINPDVTVIRNGTATSCVNNTSFDTQSYLDISTFSVIESSTSKSGSDHSKSRHRGTGSSTTVVKASTTSTDKLGFTPAATLHVGSDSNKTVEPLGLHVPVLMVVAMIACFGLALLL